MVGEFHKAFSHTVYDTAGNEIPSSVVKLRLQLILEEFRELFDQIYIYGGYQEFFEKIKSFIADSVTTDMTLNPVGIADALGDINYVVNGAAHCFGMNLDNITGEIHRSNMTKLHPVTRKPIYREDGKILKSESYEPPKLDTFVNQIIVK